MKISLISTSHRKNSQSNRVAEILEKIILKNNNKINFYNLDMGKKQIPLWTSEKKQDHFRVEFGTTEGVAVAAKTHGGFR